LHSALEDKDDVPTVTGLSNSGHYRIFHVLLSNSPPEASLCPATQSWHVFDHGHRVFHSLYRVGHPSGDGKFHGESCATLAEAQRRAKNCRRLATATSP